MISAVRERHTGYKFARTQASCTTRRLKIKLFGVFESKTSDNGANSMTQRAYFDWNATAPLRPEARAAMLAALEVIGNPSSIHAEGRAARAVIERAREQVARLVGAAAGAVTFTSGATEANTVALTPAIEASGQRQPRDRLLISAVEHTSVKSGGRF